MIPSRLSPPGQLYDVLSMELNVNSLSNWITSNSTMVNGKLNTYNLHLLQFTWVCIYLPPSTGNSQNRIQFSVLLLFHINVFCEMYIHFLQSKRIYNKIWYKAYLVILKDLIFFDLFIEREMIRVFRLTFQRRNRIIRISCK